MASPSKEAAAFRAAQQVRPPAAVGVVCHTRSAAMNRHGRRALVAQAKHAPPPEPTPDFVQAASGYHRRAKTRPLAGVAALTLLIIAAWLTAAACL